MRSYMLFTLANVSPFLDPRPRLALEGEALAYFQQLRLDAVVSVSHDGDYAMASVILQQEVE